MGEVAFLGRPAQPLERVPGEYRESAIDEAQGRGGLTVFSTFGPHLALPLLGALFGALGKRGIDLRRIFPPAVRAGMAATA